MRYRGSILVAFALLGGGCGSERSYAPWPPMPAVGRWSAPQWRAIASDLRPAVARRSPNVCTRGANVCMDAVVAEMTQRLDRLAAACDHLAPFALMYRQVSHEVRRSVRARSYRDPAYVAHLDAVFATLYFRALDDWRLGRRDEVPRAWRLAFSAASSRSVIALGDLLLGMNAHISRDLPYTLAAVGLRLPDGGDAVPDVVHVNDEIARAQSPMLAEVARRFDPNVAEAVRIGRTGNPRRISDVIAAWRLEAVRNARRLLAAKTRVERRRIDIQIDANATVRALLIWNATSYRQPEREAEARRRHCVAGRSSAAEHPTEDLVFATRKAPSA